VYTGWATPQQQAIKRATPAALAEREFATGSMGPKVRAACTFVESTGGLAVIGSITQTPSLINGTAGTSVTSDAPGLELY
jgi:carbamate kinase